MIRGRPQAPRKPGGCRLEADLDERIEGVGLAAWLPGIKRGRDELDRRLRAPLVPLVLAIPRTELSLGLALLWGLMARDEDQG